MLPFTDSAVKAPLPLSGTMTDMTPEDRSRMDALCAQIAVEKDQRKFLKLVEELNDLLERSQHKLTSDSPPGKMKF